ncbi:hypothetical protein BYT27DRAFT_7214157 [Phlegmacium glaucopus]|nr:hypothetical protein BYT27DRAFT_7214505 [Phlegmacium glaucopus]KAF8804057.1 hypothetical protein BYT27DRAFT_7214157 [Phlegmacium glaucopus]
MAYLKRTEPDTVEAHRHRCFKQRYFHAAGVSDVWALNAVQEIKTCTVAMAVPNSIGSGANPPSISASQPTPSPLTTLPPAPVSTSSSINLAPSSPIATVVTSLSALTTMLQASTSASSATSSAIPVPSSTSSVPTSASSAPTSVVSSSTPIGANINSCSPNQATATNSAFTLPGVFAGVSVVAFIAVGLVTYEHTKYHKQCKLRGNGAAMLWGKYGWGTKTIPFRVFHYTKYRRDHIGNKVAAIGIQFTLAAT